MLIKREVKFPIFFFSVFGAYASTDDTDFARIEIFFIRHAKSIWNDVRDPLSETNSVIISPRNSRSSSSASETDETSSSSSRSISPVIQLFAGPIMSVAQTGYGYVRGDFYDAGLSETGYSQSDELHVHSQKIPQVFQDRVSSRQSSNNKFCDKNVF